MLVQRQWMDDEQTLDLMGVVTEALEESDAVDGTLDVVAREEQDAYGGRGYVRIRYEGRAFYLQLWEEV